MLILELFIYILTTVPAQGIKLIREEIILLSKFIKVQIFYYKK